MVQAQRKEIDPRGDASVRAGPTDGPIAQLQADLARRLLDNGLIGGLHAPSAKERRVRALSTASGYLSLILGYVAVGVAIAYWMRG